MGLAVLPARLANELSAVEKAITGGESLSDNPLTAAHAEWAKSVKASHPELNAENASEIIRNEVGAVFEHVLCDAGVFKRDDNGKAAFIRFTQKLQDRHDPRNAARGRA